MQSSGPPATVHLIEAVTARNGRVEGVRAVIEFAPKLVSLERLCAGVVVRTTDGEVIAGCALDKRKIENAFGLAGKAIYEIAHALCASLTQHWLSEGDPQTWIPPFEGASIARVNEFTARSAEAAIQQGLELHSTLGTLLAHYDIAEQSRNVNIVERVKTAVKRDVNAKHLTTRFNRTLPLGRDAAPMRVDFLGQNFACYFLQVVRNARSSEVNAERALGKLFELQTLKRFIAKPKKSLGLLEEERPKHFELVMIGSRTDAIQRRIVYQVEAMADKSQVDTLVLDSAIAAAEHVAHKERLAA